MMTTKDWLSIYDHDQMALAVLASRMSRHDRLRTGACLHFRNTDFNVVAYNAPLPHWGGRYNINDSDPTEWATSAVSSTGPWVQHAEELCVLRGLRMSQDRVSLQQCSLYCTKEPCEVCARLIVGAKIIGCVYYIAPTPTRAGGEILKRAGIACLPAPKYTDDERQQFDYASK